jgi:hypothetical protein
MVLKEEDDIIKFKYPETAEKEDLENIIKNVKTKLKNDNT